MAKSIMALFILGTLFVMVSGFGLSGSASDPSTEGATSPSDTTIDWVNTNDGKLYKFYSWAQLWMDEGDLIHLVGATSPFTGNLRRFNNVPTDTTTASPDGWWRPDSSVITSYNFSAEQTSSPDCSVNVFANRLAEGPVEIFKVNWTTSTAGAVKLTHMMSDSCRIAGVVTAAITGPADPVVLLRVRNFVRPQ